MGENPYEPPRDPIRQPDRPGHVRLTTIIFLLCLIGFIGLAVLCDLVLGITFHELARVFVFLAFLSLPALVMALVSRRLWTLTAYVAGVTIVVAIVATPWNARKQFVWDLYSVRQGMSVDEVEAVMGGYIKGMGTKFGESRAEYPIDAKRNAATGTMTYRWNDSDACCDADWGQVTFQQGRVVKVEFISD
jgi:hypothetical protein